MTRYAAGSSGFAALVLVVTAAGMAGCRHDTAAEVPRGSGYVEATDIRVASKVQGRVAEVLAVEGQHVAAGATLVRLATTDTDLALTRTRADRAQADAQLRLLKAGTRPEDIAQAEAQVAAARSERAGDDADLTAARNDETRFEQLVRANAGATKQRDDAVSRRQVAEARLRGADDKVRAATATLDRLKAGARAEELDAARAHLAGIDAQIATLEQDRTEAIILAPSAGVVSSRLVEPGELVTPRTPLIILVDLDHAWASAYVEEPLVASLRIDQEATVITDGGDRLTGRISFISPQAEFTPRNVQTTAERAKLVYRVKVSVDNQKGILKPGMPVEVEFGPGR